MPIGSNLDVAQEMLRRIAQAQAEFNQQGGKQFLTSGDRTLDIALAKVKANPERGYYFELLTDK